MTLVDVLIATQQAGLTVRAKGDVLRVTPADGVTPV